MENGIEINDELIARYLAGEATPEEAMALDDWLKEPINRLHFMGLQNTWYTSFPLKSPREVNVERAWSIVRHSKDDVQQRSSLKGFAFTRKTVFQLAASIILLLTFGVILYFSYRNEKSVEIAIQSGDSLQQIKFSDHSTAILNRNSVLTYPATFGKQEREIRFTKGEAFFNITPDVNKPFIIRTNIASIKVLGTAFNVTLKQGGLEVSVDQGKVLVYIQTDSVYLEAGDAASLKAGAPAFDIHTSNRNVWAYATHKFVFNNTSLREVFNYVEKAQDCSIHMENAEIGNCKLTATFESVSTDYMLTLITEALNLSVTKNDDRTFTVEGEGCH